MERPDVDVVVEVRYFGRLMIAAGVDKEKIRLSSACPTVSMLIEELTSRYGEDLRQDLAGSCTVVITRGAEGAASQSVGTLDTMLCEGDEVTFVYPFTGG